MTGVKGKSGRTKTIAQRKRRTAAAKAGGIAKSKALAKSIDPRPSGAVTWDETFTGPFNSIADYDKRLGPVQSWPDVERREKAIAQILNNESLSLANAVSRGNLLTKKRVEERDAVWNATAGDLADAAQWMVDSIPHVTAEQRAAFLEAFRLWRTALGDGLSKVCVP